MVREGCFRDNCNKRKRVRQGVLGNNRCLYEALQLINGAVNSHHLDSGLSCFHTFVTGFTTCAVKSLLLIIYGKNPEYHRNIAIGIEMGNTLGDALAYVVKMRSIPFDYTSDYYNGIKISGLD